MPQDKELTDPWSKNRGVQSRNALDGRTPTTTTSSYHAFKFNGQLIQMDSLTNKQAAAHAMTRTKSRVAANAYT